MNGGYVRIWRSILGHPVLRGDAPALLLFFYAIVSAAWRPTPWDVAGQIISLQPGQFFTCWSTLSTDTGLTVKQLRRAAKKLAAAHMISAVPRANRGILVTVHNYGDYQGSRDDRGQTEVPTKGTTEGRTEGTLSKKEEGKKEEGRRRDARRLGLPLYVLT